MHAIECARVRVSGCTDAVVRVYARRHGCTRLRAGRWSLVVYRKLRKESTSVNSRPPISRLIGHRLVAAWPPTDRSDWPSPVHQASMANVSLDLGSPRIAQKKMIQVVPPMQHVSPLTPTINNVPSISRRPKSVFFPLLEYRTRH